MEILWFIVLLVGGLAYEKLWRVRVIEKKIKQYVENMGGELIRMERISSREEIFVVMYDLNELREKATVKFNFFYEQEWF